MLHGSTLTLLAIGLTLSGCGIAQHIQAEEPAKQQAAQSAQLVQQSKTAMAACDAEFPAGNPKTAVARRKCINDGFAIRLPTFGLDQDLVRAVLADSMVIAEKVQNGKMTIAEGNAAIGEKWSQAVAEKSATGELEKLRPGATERCGRTTASCGACEWRGCHSCRPAKLYLHPKRQHGDVQLGPRRHSGELGRKGDIAPASADF